MIQRHEASETDETESMKQRNQKDHERLYKGNCCKEILPGRDAVKSGIRKKHCPEDKTLLGGHKQRHSKRNTA